MDAMFKKVYAKNVENLIPKSSRLQQDCKFVPAEQREGGSYNQPVALSRSHGWTLSTAGDAFALNAPEPARSDVAVVTGSSFVLRDAISYDAAAKAVKGDRAFVNGTSYLIENMTDTASFVLELQLMHGQRNVGVVESRSNDSGTTQTFVFSKATFIAAMWSGLEKGFVEFYNGATLLTPSETQVVSVAIETRAVTFTGTESELDAVEAAIGANTPGVFLRGTKSAGMVGLISQVSNTGNMFDIDAATWSLWAGNTLATTGTLTFAKIIQSVDKPVSRGLMSDMRFYVSPRSWTDCQNDLAALRRYANKAGGKLEQGAEELVYYGQNGSIELVPHIFMKPSEAFGMPKGKAIRLGASDTTFSLPGQSAGKYWENLPDHAGYGTRCYWNQAGFLPCPAQGILISGIVNSVDA
jgi:hypothetical protein